MSRKRARSPSPSPDHSSRSEPIEDRGSTFVGLYSPTLSARTLQATPDLQPAMHRMCAWRKSSTQQTLGSSQHPSQLLYETGHDDDGEKWAGKKLETVLSSMKIEGSVVVARWFGGVMLGPVRFTHIESCAREAIKAWQTAEGEESKKRKIEAQEKEDKQRLEDTLAERDNSISVLRDLLTERRLKKNADRSSQPKMESTSSSKQVIDYHRMPLEALRRLEKARDATLAFILKELDKLELDQLEQQTKATEDASRAQASIDTET